MEIEFKFGVPREKLAALERELKSGESTRKPLQARYFDTADAALAAHGVVLRLRREGTQWVQTAKAVVAGQGPLHRLEHNVVLDAGEAGPGAVPDPARHGDSPVGRLLQKAMGRSPTPLVETMATDIWRLARHDTVGGSTVELALDVGEVTGGAPGAARAGSAVCELELELVHGRVEDLVQLAAQWAQRHGLWFSTLSKAERGQRLAHGEPPGGFAVKASAPHFEGPGKARRRPVGAVAVQRAVLASCLAQVLPNASEAAAGRADVEVVHQLRVGLRRLRTALRELETLTPPNGPRFDPAWAPVLQGVFRALGAQRDEAVVRAAIEPALDAAGAPTPVALPAKSASAVPSDPGAVVRSPAFQAALIGLIGFTAAEDNPAAENADGLNNKDGASGSSADAARDPRHVLARRLSRLHHRVLRDGARFDSLAPDERHRVRKRLKRLRDLAVFVGPLFGRKAALRYADGLGRAQDALGLYQDRVVALAHYRQSSPEDTRAWFAVGWLTAQQPAVTRAAGKSLARLARLDRFWK